MTALLIDGNSIVYRAYFATGEGGTAARADGLPTGAVSGFCSRMWDLLRDTFAAENISHGAIIFDHPGRNWRHDIYPEYKANRGGKPDDLVCQLRLAREVAPAFGLRSIAQPGYEADDLIATYAAEAAAAGERTIIVSVDKDLMQLVDDGVVIYDPMKGEWLGEGQVLERFGVTPRLVADALALSGDTTDNVPGAAGIGRKTAAELLDRFGSLNGVIRRAAEIRQPKRRESIEAFAPLAPMSRQLVALDDRVPLDVQFDDLVRSPIDGERLVSFLNALQIRSFTDRVCYAFGIEHRIAADAALLAFAEEMTMWRLS